MCVYIYIHMWFRMNMCYTVNLTWLIGITLSNYYINRTLNIILLQVDIIVHILKLKPIEIFTHTRARAGSQPRAYTYIHTYTCARAHVHIHYQLGSSQLSGSCFRLFNKITILIFGPVRHFQSSAPLLVARLPLGPQYAAHAAISHTIPLQYKTINRHITPNRQ